MNDFDQKIAQLQAERDTAMDAAIDARGDTAHAVHQANQLRQRVWELEEALAPFADEAACAQDEKTC